VNHKRTYRLYSEEGLSIRPKLPRRKRAWRYRVGRPGATAPNEVWSMDFVSDGLFDGRPIRILAVLDCTESQFPGVRRGGRTQPAGAGTRAAEDAEG
jgi:transposase InsO family protein